MSKLTRCPRCGTPLVSHEVVHAVRGVLYCSKKCAVEELTDEYQMNAKEMAIEAYDNEVEVVQSEDILKEDLQEVRLTLTCTTVIRLPRDMSEEDALVEASKLYKDGLVIVEPDDCDEVTFKCELVRDTNTAEDAE